MADEEKPLSLLSQDELDEQLQADKSDQGQVETTYEGPNRRLGKDRRKGSRDRREMLRFEPEKDRADRREGKDRRKENNAPDDLWKQRDI